MSWGRTRRSRSRPTGAPPLNYQWQFYSSTLSNQINTTLVLTNVQTADAGRYTVVVTNSEGAVTNLVATLAVLMPPSITKQPANQSGELGGQRNILSFGR